jgi:magnesium-transporting ATPase (P-type)
MTTAPRTETPEHAWWRLSPDEALGQLGTTRDGLSSEEAAARLKRYGRNEIEGTGGVTPLAILVRQFKSPLIYILMIAAVVTLVLQEFIDSAIIAAVLILNAAIGFWQEYGAERSVEALQKLATARAHVMRDGRDRDIDSRELVPGDVVLLEAGSRVPADCRLVEAAALEADESLLTGESTTVGKSIPELAEDVPIGDRVNMLFMGTIVTRGRSRAVVVATGARTELGLIAGSVREVGEVQAPLQQRMASFARLIGVAVIAISVTGFVVGWLLGEPADDLFLTMVALAVAAIPEGLPIVLTIVLAIGVRRMANRNVIIRQLPAVETLGSCDAIGSDKTGTLTQNRMTVQRIYTAGHEYDVSGTGYRPEGEILSDGGAATIEEWTPLHLTLLAGALSNDSSVDHRDGDEEATGDPTEVALLVSGMKAGMVKQELERRLPRIAEVPFDSEKQYAATFHRDDGRTIALVKGAPERVLDMCATDEGAESLDRDEVLGRAHGMAERGLRVLAMAWREVGDEVDSSRAEDYVSDLRFVGLQGMMDPPREEAKAAVRGCQQAGVRVVMITGDHAVTALAIARELGIATEDDRALTGREMAEISDEDFVNVVQEVPVFARVSPQDKLRIVQALRGAERVVAVTGDGVNDAPALRAADIGVAMGKSGTDVAKEASDMVITDDNFVSVFAAVEEGRVAFDNVRKVSFFLISTGLGTVLPVLVAMLLRYPLIMLPAQLLWLNLVTKGIQDVALAFEPGEKDVLKRKPRPRHEGVISPLLWERTIIVGIVLTIGTLGMFIYEWEQRDDIAYARTVALTTLVLFQAFHLGNSRSEYLSLFKKSPFSNNFLLIGNGVAVAIHIAALYLPFTQFILRVEPLELSTWLLMIPVAASILVVVEIHKLLRPDPDAKRPLPQAAAAT